MKLLTGNEELDFLLQNRGELSEQIKGLQTRLTLANNQIKDICHHPKEHVKERSYYFPGGYLDRSYEEYWNECMICGSVSEKIRDSSNGSYA